MVAASPSVSNGSGGLTSASRALASRRPSVGEGRRMLSGVPEFSRRTGGAFIEVGKELPFSKVPQPLPDMDPQIVRNGRFLSLPVPQDHGIAHAPLCFLEAEFAGPGAPGFASNFLEDAQVHRDHPSEVGVELGDTLGK